MNKYLIIIAVGFIISLIQTSFLGELFGPTLNPNLLIALSFSLLLMDEEELSMFSAFISGAFVDLVALRIIGLNMLLYSLMVYVLYLVRRYIFRSFWLQIVLIIILNYLSRIIDNVLSNNGLFDNFGFFMVSSLLTAFFTLVFYALNNYIKERFLQKDYKIK